MDVCALKNVRHSTKYTSNYLNIGYSVVKMI